MEPPDQPTSHPPSAPELPRRIRLRPLHAVGMGLIALIPLCAAAGLFGPTRATADAAGAGLELTVDYPSRCRYEVIETMEIRVRNTTAQAMDGVTIALDPAWLDGFSQVQFTPTIDPPYHIQLPRLEPGATALVTGELNGERYGRRRGAITARAGEESAAVELSTFIFP